MPKTIDQRVVEMQFDNKNFEKNVSESMSTLDKLKEKLNFRGASKAIDELNGSMKGFNVSPIESALSGIGGKFSAFEQIAIGSLRRIGEEALATGEKLIKSLTTDNIEAGWSKYGQKTTSVSTLVAQGYQLEEVNKQLERLNWFTDETSYNFTAMVGEIGKFTASGQGLEDSVTAMMGIANWAALSGQNATKASQAMYQLSQAMSKGALRYDDWKSIQNASMDTKEFREMAADAAIELGSLVKVGDDAYKLVYEAADGTRELSEEVVTLNDLFTSDYLTKKQWLDTDVMMSTFNAYGKASKTLKTLIDDEWEGVETASAAMDTLENKAKEVAKEIMAVDSSITEDDAMNQALMKVSLESVKNLDAVKDEVYQYIDSVKESTGTTLDFDTALVDLGYGIDSMSLKALKAAQQARTWEDVIDSVKDAVSTGWMNTFEKLFGNQDEAVQLWTRLANDFWDIFAAGGDDRNSLLDMWRNWFDPKVRELKEAAVGIPSSVREAIGKTNLVNGRDLLFSTDENNLGAIISLLQTLKDLLGVIKDAWNETFYGTTDADEIAWQKADMLMAITKAIKAFADALVINEEKADKLRRTFKGLFAVIGIIKDFVGKAFTAVWSGLSSIFGGVSIDILDMTANLGDSIVAFREWLNKNKIFENAFNGIGTAISNVVNWIKNLITNIKSIPWVADTLNNIRGAFETAGHYIGEFFDRIGKGENAGAVFKSIIDRMKDTSVVVSFLIEKFNAVKDFLGNMFAGIGGGKDFGSFISEITDNVKNGFGSIGDIFTNVKNAISDFWSGTATNLQNAQNGIGAFVEGVKKLVGEINGERIIQLISGTAIFIFLFKMISTIKTFLDFFGTIGEAFETIANAVKNVGKSIGDATKRISKAMAENLRAKSLISIAIAIGILVAALAALYFMMDDSGKLLAAAGILVGIVVAITVLSGVVSKADGLFKAAFAISAIAGSLFGLVAAIKILSDVAGTKGGRNAVGIVVVLTVIAAAISGIAFIIAKKMNGLDQAIGIGARLKAMATFLISFAGAVLVLAVAARMLASADVKGLTAAVIAIGVLVAALATLIVLTNVFQNSNFKGLGLMLFGISTSLLIFGAAIVMFSLIPEDIFEKGIVRVGLVAALCAALIAVSFLSGDAASKAGSMILKMSIAFALMVGVIKLITLVSDDELARGLAVIAGFSLICTGLIIVSRAAGDAAAKAGLMLIELSAAMVILTGVMWALAYLPTEGLAKAAIVTAGLMIVFGFLIAISNYAKNEKDITKTLIVLTVAIVALAGSVFALSLLDPKNVMNAAAAMGVVLLAFAAVIGVTKYAKKAMSTLIILTVAVGIMGAILYLLGQSDKDAGNALKNAAGIALLLTSMAGVLFILSKISKSAGNITAQLVPLAIMTLLVGFLGSIIKDMSTIAFDTAIQNATALSILLIAMGATMVIVSKFANNVQGVIVGSLGLLALSGVVAILSAVLQDMAKVHYADYITEATALSELLIAMSVVMAIVSAIGTGGAMTGGVGLVGILAGIIALYALSGVVAILSAVLQDMAKVRYADYITEATALSELLIAMSVSLAILGVAGILAIPALLGIAVMMVAVEGMMALVTKIGELMAQTPQIQEFIDNGIPVIEQLGEAIGTFFGNVVGGFIKGIGNNILDLLPTLGMKLSEFSVYILPFIATMRSIKPEDLQNAQALVSAIVMLTAAEFINGITNFLGFLNGGNDMNSFASHLALLGNGIADFSTAVSGNVDSDGVGIAVDSLTKLVNLESAINIFTTIGATNGLTYFATQMKTIGEGIANFSQAVKGNVDSTSVQTGVDSLAKLVDLNGKVNIFTTISQAASLSYFGTQMKYIGQGLADFSKAVNGKLYPQSNEYAFTVLKKLVEINDAVNVITTIAAAAELTLFASQMGYIGQGIADFSAKVAGNIANDDVTNAITALGSLVTISGDINILTTIAQAAGLENFATKLGNIGSGIVGFSNTVSGQIDKESDDNALDVIERLSELEKNFDIINTIIGISGLDKFASNLPNIGQAIADFSKNVNGHMYPAANEQAFSVLNKMATFKNQFGSDPFSFIGDIVKLSQLDLFASNLPAIGKGIGGFVTNIGGSLGTSMVSDSVRRAMDILVTLAGIQKDVTGDINPWDFIEKVSGFTELSLFSDNLPFIAKGIAGFAKNISGTTGDDGISSSIDIITSLGELSKLIEDTMDSEKIEGVVTLLNSYHDSISNLGDAIKKIAEDSAKYSSDDIQNISDRIDQLTALADKAKGVDTTAISNAFNVGGTGTFDYTQYLQGGNIDYSSFSVGGSDAIGAFASGMADPETVSGMEKTFSGLFGKGGGLDVSSLCGVDGDIGSLFGLGGGKAIESFMSGMTDNDAIAGVKEKITGLFGEGGGIDVTSMFGEGGDIGNIFSGAGDLSIGNFLGSFTSEDNKASAEESGKQLSTNVVNGYKAGYENMRQAGKNSVDGLLNAIKDMTPQAQAAGEKIAKALTSGIEIQLQIASPSKVMYCIGEYAGEGFVKALTDYVAITNQVGGDLGDSATNGIRDALAKSADMFDTSVDVEPTIRPVLDLSNIDQGIGQLDGMFNANRSIELAGNTAISMDGRASGIQNEITVDNKDVVSAIRELRGDMGELADRFSKLQVILDTNVLVGQLTDPMDTALGSRVNRRKRG